MGPGTPRWDPKVGPQGGTPRWDPGPHGGIRRLMTRDPDSGPDPQNTVPRPPNNESRVLIFLIIILKNERTLVSQ